MGAEEVNPLIQKNGGQRSHPVQKQLCLSLLDVLFGDEPVVDDFFDWLLQGRLVLPQLFLGQDGAVDGFEVPIALNHEMRCCSFPGELMPKILEAPLLRPLIKQTLPCR